MSEYKDKFSEASQEQQDKSAFICEHCKTKYTKQQVEEKDNSCCGRTVKELHQESFVA